MPRIDADFSNIKANASFDAIPAGEYRAVISEKPEHGLTKKNQLPQVTFVLEVTEGEQTGAKLFDFVTLKTAKGEPNPIGLGRIKAYAAAALGEEAANAPDGIDTDDLEGGTVLVEVGIRSYDKDNADGSKETKTANEIKKVFPAG